MLDRIAYDSQNIIVSVGLPIAHNNALYNVAALICDGAVLGFVPKQHLASDGVHYEPRWFKAWQSKYIDTSRLRGIETPIGDLVFDIKSIGSVQNVRIGFEICEDAWVADRPGVELSKRGVDIILNPSASHFAFGKHEIRKRFVTEGSRAFRCVYVYSNLLGNESGRVIFDGDTMIASNGKVEAIGNRLIFSDQQLIFANVDLDLNKTSQIQNGSFRPTTDAGYEVFGHYNFVEHEQEYSFSEPDESDEPDECSEFSHAVALGLFDYMRKSHSNGFVLSLSGGADSAAVACLVRLMCEFGIGELGIQGFLRKLGVKSESDNINEIMSIILTCVYQATENSSKETEEAAATLATTIGAKFMSINVNNIVNEYIKFGAQFKGKNLYWDSDDVALQNIQARVRAPSVWLIANLSNALLLATSNRSEAAVGYATMDGDTCGGLSPIAGIDKEFILNWIRRIGSEGGLFFTALRAVLKQKPTAELRPQSESQTDEEDLMPYNVLNFIEGAAIRDKQGPAEVFVRLEKKFPHYSRKTLNMYLSRFFKLWARNQWKRERYAIAFHLDDRSLDPKTWCRFPVLSGGFDLELFDHET